MPAAAVLGVGAVPPPVEPDEGWPVALLCCGRRAAGPEVAVTAGAAVGVPGEAGVAAATVEETGVSDSVRMVRRHRRPMARSSSSARARGER